jgi:hypothetical protein
MRAAFAQQRKQLINAFEVGSNRMAAWLRECPIMRFSSMVMSRKIMRPSGISAAPFAAMFQVGSLDVTLPASVI